MDYEKHTLDPGDEVIYEGEVWVVDYVPYPGCSHICIGRGTGGLLGDTWRKTYTEFKCIEVALIESTGRREEDQSYPPAGFKVGQKVRSGHGGGTYEVAPLSGHKYEAKVRDNAETAALALVHEIRGEVWQCDTMGWRVVEDVEEPESTPAPRAAENPRWAEDSGWRA